MNTRQRDSSTVDRLLDRVLACALTVDYPRLAWRRLNVSAGRRLWKSECLPRSRNRGKTLGIYREIVNCPSIEKSSIDRTRFLSTYLSLNLIINFNSQESEF